jgi:hypothetical protein
MTFSTVGTVRGAERRTHPQAWLLCLTLDAATWASEDANAVARCWQHSLVVGVSVAGVAATQCGQIPAAAKHAAHRAGSGISTARPAAKTSTQRAVRAGLRTKFRITLLSKVAASGQESFARAKREPKARTRRTARWFRLGGWGNAPDFALGRCPSHPRSSNTPASRWPAAISADCRLKMRSDLRPLASDLSITARHPSPAAS